ncbi:fibronectin type III domain-containing protein [Xylanibacter muris]|uniref:Fibronectin type-III domain-containing protein n=1 Tax=Xylanibacter muris TaxID=2736290 RepID=A0ABX2AR48_9BACT|nr:fibronectin type III domain-containing protein [Xylanibacter muris]NPD92426.1 hypothetical protein [Xylanibacter muris]
MDKKHLPLLFSMLLGSSCLSATAQQLAFPGAQGWGRFATGGRTGTVYHVTNLNDSGEGSLRDAISQPNRIIVFDVAGVINIKSRLVFKNNLYVAGQTAPGEGITVYGNGVSFSGASNIIVRHMRFRMGRKGDSGKDAAGIANGQNMIFDHCSVSWGLDETFSINPDGKGATPQNITISNTIMGQGLTPHSAGGLMQTDYITLYRNFYCDNSTRNNKIKGRNQYVNNIVYNWQNGAYIMGGDSEGESFCNIEGNLFINGPAKGGDAFTGGNSNFHFYGNDNWQDKNMDGVFDPSEVTRYSAADPQSTPYDYPELEKVSGKSLLETVLPTVGASLPYRDYADCYMVDEVMSYGKKGALIANEETLIYGAPNTWNVWKGNDRKDTDGDGMPDEWEDANGTDKMKNDAMVIAENGYANIENYINSITVENRDYFLRMPMCIELATAKTTSLKIEWRDYTYGEDGFAIEFKKENGGEWNEIHRTGAGETTYTIENLEPGTPYLIRMRAFAGTDKFSDYTAEQKMTTRPIEVGVVDIDAYEPDLTWKEGAASWDFTTQGWNNGSDVFADGKKVLFAPVDNETVTLNETVSPEVVVVNGDGNITINGTGSIAGSGSVNKGGSGVLSMNTANKYSGATVLHEGTFEFNTLKNGGEPSAIGASTEFAQNWIFDGGTYKYTGGSTSTNRSAKITRETEFNIANKGTVVTMTGSLEGNDNFILNGNGQLTVATDKFFTHTGATILRGGTMYLSTTAISKAGIGSSSKLVFAGGELKTKGETSGDETYSFPIEVLEGEISQFSPNRNCYMKNKFTGSGTLQLNIPYLRERISGNFSEFTGRIIANGVNSKDSEGSLFLIENNNIDLTTFVVETKGNTRVCNWTTNGNQTLGGLAGDKGTYLAGSSKNTSNFTCTWNVGSANTNETFNGVINNWDCSSADRGGKVNVNKVGTGEWRLTGNNVYKGSTGIKGGTLIVNGTNSGTGAVTVSKEAVLKGKGTVAGKVTVFDGGMIMGGDTLVNISSLKLTGGCTVNAGGMIGAPLVYNATNKLTKTNKVKVTGNFVINDAVLNLDLTEAGSIPDDTGFSILDLTGATVSGSGFKSIIPERPSVGQKWDTSELLTTGRIYVRNEGNSINGVEADSRKDEPKYTLSGNRVDGNSKGLIIQKGKKYVKK